MPRMIDSSDGYIAEVERIRERYAKRKAAGTDARYARGNEWGLLATQEIERALHRWAVTTGYVADRRARLLEVGCGSGGILHRLLGIGFAPHQLIGLELLADRADQARTALPAGIEVITGELVGAGLPTAAFDVVLQATVLSSILDPSARSAIAAEMWHLVRPGGGVLSYDLAYDNPRNPDVKRVSVGTLRALFPAGQVTCWRVTLAPPLARAALLVGKPLYHLLAAVPLLRSHRLCWIQKTQATHH